MNKLSVLRKVIQCLLVEALSQQDYEDTFSTARLVHLGQKRRSGEDYFDHPVAVEKIVKQYYPSDLSAQLLALLHDTIEDRHKQNNLSQSELIEMIRGSIHDRSQRREIMTALRLLSHDKSVPYNEYLNGIAHNYLALRVKLSDMMHNASSSPSVSQLEKYRNGFLSLLEFFGGKAPPMIHRKQWEALAQLIGIKA